MWANEHKEPYLHSRPFKRCVLHSVNLVSVGKFGREGGFKVLMMKPLFDQFSRSSFCLMVLDDLLNELSLLSGRDFLFLFV